MVGSNEDRQNCRIAVIPHYPRKTDQVQPLNQPILSTIVYGRKRSLNHGVIFGANQQTKEELFDDVAENVTENVPKDRETFFYDVESVSLIAQHLATRMGHSLVLVAVFSATHGLTLIGLLSPVRCDVLDLTHPFNNNTVAWPSSKIAFTINHFSYSSGLNADVHEDTYVGKVHAGTHMDSPFHIGKGKWTVDQIPIDHLMNVPAIVIDISKRASRNKDYNATEDDLMDWINTYGAIPEKSVVLFNTGWSKYYIDPPTYFGSPDLDVQDLHFPGIGTAVAEWLVENTNIVGVGLDTPSLDPGNAKKFFAHYTFFGSNVYGLENLKGLDRLPPKGIRLHVVPMLLTGASGAPCRVFAEVLNNKNQADFKVLSNSLILFSAVVILSCF
ncbi:Kynurenine formamidase [Nymphon striatum]|nr:Kynurenine formamidase [Nymphon striatum]